MRMLVTGSAGQLGRALAAAVAAPEAPHAYRDSTIDWVDVADLDITDADAVDA